MGHMIWNVRVLKILLQKIYANKFNTLSYDSSRLVHLDERHKMRSRDFIHQTEQNDFYCILDSEIHLLQTHNISGRSFKFV